MIVIAGLLLILAIFAFGLVYICGVAVLYGWVLSKLWLWFMVPFFGFKPLTLAYAIGISLVIRFMTFQYIPLQAEEDKSWERAIALLAAPILGGLFTLGFGYIVHLYV